MSTSIAASPSNAKPTGQSLTADNSGLKFERRTHHVRPATWLEVFDWIVVCLVALVAVALHVRFVTHAGGLWRDEANSVEVANLPRITDIWHSLDFDSFPLLFFALLRFWGRMFGADNDSSLRALGLITGLGVLVAAWFSSKTLGARKPVLSLALIGLNPMVIRYGDSTRAYGLGILLILLTFTAFWRLVASHSATRGRAFTAGLLGVLSVQCIYYNAVLLFAIIAATIVVCIRRQAWRTAWTAFAIGMAAAASLLPYIPMMRRMQEWTFLVKYPGSFWWLWQRSGAVLGSPDPIGRWIWAGLFITCAGVAAVTLLPNRNRTAEMNIGPDPDASRLDRLPDAVLFAAVALIVAVPAYAGFLLVLGYYTQPWYFISLAVFAACAMNVVFGAWPNSTKLHLSIFLRGLRLLIAVGLASSTALPDWKEVASRQTNVDLVAAQLRAFAGKEDVVLVPQWENAVSLCHYYHGPAQVITIPDVPEHRFHRYDLVLRQMMETDPVQGIWSRLEKALRSNHSVFIAGNLAYPPPSLHLRKLPPAPAHSQAANGLKYSQYYTVWQLQIGQSLRAHADRIGQVTIPVPNNASVMEFEDVNLHVVRGWRTDL